MKTKPKNMFQKMADRCPIKCDICGGTMHAMHGGGWDNDRIMCAEHDCHAEIEFPTSTEFEPEEVKND